MSVFTSTPPVGKMICGCIRDRYSMTTLCVVGQKLKAETKKAHREADDRTIKGAAKTELCRNFDRKRSAYREHIGVGS